MSEESAARLRAAQIGRSPWIVTGDEKKIGPWASLKELWHRRELVALLTRREIRARFKDSSLGLLWSFARPLAQFAVYYFALGQVLGLSRQIPNFAIFVFVGLTGWLFFSESVQKATTSILTNASLVKKVQLPRTVFPLSSIGSVAFMSFTQAVVLLTALIALKSPPLLSNLPYALAGLAVLAVFTVGLGLLFAALTVRYRDVEHLVEVAFVVLFWASPIVYSFTFVHEYLDGSWAEELYLANPVTVAILGLQRGLWSAGAEGQAWPHDLYLRLLFMFIAGLVLLLIAHAVFRRREGDFAQEI